MALGSKGGAQAPPMHVAHLHQVPSPPPPPRPLQAPRTTLNVCTRVQAIWRVLADFHACFGEYSEALAVQRADAAEAAAGGGAAGAAAGGKAARDKAATPAKGAPPPQDPESTLPVGYSL